MAGNEDTIVASSAREDVVRVKAEIQNDQLEKLATGKPIVALAELIWNGFDADATRIDVNVDRNPLGGIEAIRIVDNGHGIEHAEALDAFKKFGGSWKKSRKRSRTENRILHGQDGQGRYRAFALGDRVEWNSVYKAADGSPESISITGRRPDLTEFEISDPKPAKGRASGTEVVVRNLRKQFTTFDDPNQVAEELAVRFAPNLREYPGVSITFDGKEVDPRRLEDHFAEYDLPPVTFEDGTEHKLQLVVIEWKIPVDRALYFCDENGFAFEKRPPGIHAPEFTFTAYARSTGVRDLEDRAAFAWSDGHPDLDRIVAEAKEGLRVHFLARRAMQAQDLITQWKAEQVYPYSDEPSTSVERAERQVFDVVAKNVRDHLPEFDESDPKSKRFSLHLLRRAIETSPGDVQQIIQEVLDLPQEKASDLAQLLQRTTLSAIIEASKVVADRLDFLRGLEILLYDAASKKALLERAQLQKILEDHTWIFGEEFALSVADQSLDEVLRKHLHLLGREPGADHESEVTLPDGRRGIVDLMLSRQIPQPRAEQLEHLVVELKRPSQKITKKVLSQTEDYALAVAKDARFRDADVMWHFWAVSNDLDDVARDKVTQTDRPFGLLLDKQNPRIKVWSMPWSLIIDRCRGRLRFYQEKLEYNATDQTAIDYLRAMHDKYLPDVLKSATD